MIKILYVLFIVLSPSIFFGQNIILNGSFEDTLKLTTQLYLPRYWHPANQASPDLFTPYNSVQDWTPPVNFAGNQQPKSGKAYAGIKIYTLNAPNNSKRNREYLRNRLSRSLEKDSLYCIRLFVSLADSFPYASKNKLGIYFSRNKISSSNNFYLPVLPQILLSPDTFITDKKNWVEFTYQYKAIGNERYMTIGNFTDSTEIDTLFVPGGSKDIGYKGSYYFIDDVWLSHCDSLPVDSSIGLEEYQFKNQIQVHPNPTQGQIIIPKSERLVSIALYDLHGRLVQNVIPSQTGETTIEINQEAGVYVLQFQMKDGSVQSTKVVKH